MDTERGRVRESQEWRYSAVALKQSWNSGISKILAGDPQMDSACVPKTTIAVKIPKSAPYIRLDAGSGHFRWDHYQILMLNGVVNLTNGGLGKSNTIPQR